MRVLSKGLMGLGALTLAAAPLAVSAATSGLSAGAQAVEPIVVQFGEGSHDFVVPDDVHCVSYDLVGAQGGLGGGNGTPGGLGGEVSGDLEVLPGQTLQVNIGGRGGDATGNGIGGAGGFNGGGPGGTATATGSNEGGGGGGGASDIRQGGTTLADRAAVAGGGGGSGSFSDTPNGGGGQGGPDEVGGATAGTDGSGATGGGPGTETAGGAGGVSGSDPGVADGAAGSFGAGGTGGGGSVSNIDAGGGGGGAGWYGGGGGGGADVSTTGGGGGGVNFIATFGNSTAGVDADNNGDGAGTISYQPGDTSCVEAPLTITKTVGGAPAPAAGTKFTVAVQCLDATIDLGSVGRPGFGSSVELTFTVDANGVAQPAAGQTVSFVEENQCTVIETGNGGAASTSYTCTDSVDDRPILQPGAAFDDFGSSAIVPAPGDFCVTAGPQADPMVVNIDQASQVVAVNVTNMFAAAAAAVTPRFTG